MNRMQRIARRLWLPVAAVAACGDQALAEVIEVPGDAATIQAALLASAPGDEILVAPGIYPGPIDLTDHGVTLRSLAGPAVTVIEAPAASFAVTILGDSNGPSTLQGFTIRPAMPSDGGGVRVLDSVTSIIDCVFSGCGFVATGDRAGCAMDLERSEVTISGCFVKGCVVGEGLLGAIGAVDALLAIQGSAFEQNAGVCVGAIGTKMTLTDSIYRLPVDGSRFIRTFDGCTLGLLGCSMSDAGGTVLELRDSCQATIESCQFQSIRGSGRAIIVGGLPLPSTALFSGCQFIENKRSPATTPASVLSVEAGATATVSDCLFEDNGWSPLAAGLSCIEVIGGTLHLSDSTLAHSQGGSGALRTSGGTVVIERSDFVENSGLLGGAVSAATSSVTIVDCTFTGNRATTNAGAISAIGAGGATLAVKRSEFTGNRALTGEGGAIRVQLLTSARIDSCRFEGNTAIRGGALAIRSNATTVANALIVGNTAFDSGGGVYVGAATALRYSTIVDNEAPIGGAVGGIASPQLVGMVIWANTSTGGGVLLSHPSPTSSLSIIQGGEAGGNGSDPLFVDSANGDYRLAAESPALDLGEVGTLPSDALDLDEDLDVVEPLPLDLLGAARFVDSTGGRNTRPDAGCFERPDAPSLLGDLNGDGLVDGADLGLLLAAWGSLNDDVDLDGDGAIDGADLGILLANWSEAI